MFSLDSDSKKLPIIIAGPCVAESYALLDEVAAFLKEMTRAYPCRLLFKASFDKANRTALKSYRGPGIEKALGWMSDVKEKYHLETTTDVHECWQVKEVASVCSVLQIPAFLCRQTDLLLAAIDSGREVNIKKGQFMAPHAMGHIVEKAKSYIQEEKNGVKTDIFLTERGASFGYGDLVVDMRSLAIMASFGAPVIFDITHSTQQPSNSKEQAISKGQREFAPILARSALATGYLSGFFLEVHTNPQDAKSDAASQLDMKQAEILLKQVLPMWEESQRWKASDEAFR